MSVTVTDQAVSALNNAAQQLEELSNQIHQETEALVSVYDENKEGLGAHSASIEKLINDVKDIEEEGKIPVKKLVLKLMKSALIRAQHIGNNVYSSGGRSR